MSTGENLGPTFDFYRNAESPEWFGQTNLVYLIDSVRGDEYAARVAEIRALRAAGEDDKANDLKRKLPAVSVSGCCNGRRKLAVEQNRFTHSGLLQLDFDAKDNAGWDIEDIRALLIEDPRIVAVFISASGAGVKAIARCLPDPSKHLGCFLAAQRHFQDLTLAIDPATKECTRLCFISHDPAAWLRLDAPGQFEPEPDDEPIPAANGRKPSVIYRDDNSFTLTPDVIREMLACIPYPGYNEWLKIFNSVIAEVGIDEAISLCNAQWPEKHEGDYLKHASTPLDRVTRGTLIYHAKLNGWTPSKAMRAELRANGKDKRVAELTKQQPAKQPVCYDPDEVFYDAYANRFWAKVGKSYHACAKRSMIEHGIMRFLSPRYQKAKDLAAAALSVVDARELDGEVQWAGGIAGHAIGPTTDADGLPILITRQAHPPCPGAGDCPLLTDILAQAFPNQTAFEVFISWVAGRYKAVTGHTHVPAPMLVLAGEINSGKSLLGYIAGEMLGGRTCNPYASWSGAILWNDDMVGSELLLIDDCMGHTDMKSRHQFGAAFKEAIYPSIVQLRKRNVSAISVRPVWAAMLCCNNTPESLQIIPPLDPDMQDKIILLKVEHVSLPFDTSTPEGRRHLQSLLAVEYAGFARMLTEWETPEHLFDSRSGITAWRDPELAEAIEEHSAPRRLEDLLEMAVKNRAIWNDLPREMYASEIEARLLEIGSPVRDQARALLHWHGACGSYLAKLAKAGSSVVSCGVYDGHRKQPRYWVKS